jgi:hypothetical protein
MTVVATVSVAAVLYPVGFAISLLGSQLQCSKIGLGTSAIQAIYWALYPTLAFLLATYFPVVLAPFENTIRSFGVDGYARELALGYIMMIVSWIGTVYAIHATEKSVCVTSVDEMNAFKKKLLEELKEKDEDKTERS